MAVVGVAIGILAGSVAVVVFSDAPVDPVTSVGPAVTSFPAVDHDPEAAAAFVDAWERWRHATYVARGVWTRHLDAGGAPLSLATYVAQDPPRRLVVRGGAVLESVDGTIRSCDSDIETVTDCLAGEVGVDYEEAVERELALIRRQVSGPERAYDVGRDEQVGCWVLELEHAAAAPPWGRWARFCFDENTGALVSARIRRPSAVDAEHVVELRSAVTGADFGA